MMNLEYFKLNKEVYKIEIEKILIYYKTLYRLELEKKHKLKKQITKNKKLLENKINNLRFKISNLDTLYRFIDGESFTLEQLETINYDLELLDNDILKEVVNLIKEKINYIETLDLYSKKLELKKEIYIEELTSDIKIYVKNRQ